MVVFNDPDAHIPGPQSHTELHELSLMHQAESPAHHCLQSEEDKRAKSTHGMFNNHHHHHTETSACVIITRTKINNNHNTSNVRSDCRCCSVTPLASTWLSELANFSLLAAGKTKGYDYPCTQHIAQETLLNPAGHTDRSVTGV